MKNLSECSVLIVDDTEENIDILFGALGDEYDVSVATDGQSALDFLENTKPDIILLDIMMPGISGYEVCEKLKENKATEDIPVIMITAMTDIESKRKGFELGAVDYITKPFEVSEVQARVHTHLSLKLAKQELFMQNEILEEKVEERTEELCLTQEATIEAIAYLAEYRDPETGGHIKRTKNYVRVLAERLQENSKYKDVLSEEVVDNMYNSAPLHDIGKIGIRDDVLLKPGKLTDEEFSEMKKHTEIGFNALNLASQKLGENSFLQYAMIFSKYHHEKWDGSGYPDHIAGGEIPIAGRIMAIADVYDALTSARVYKPAFPHQKAVEIIVEESGKHFDPEIVEAFLSVKDEFEKISKLFSDP
ncbi:MAG: two-component system response regulator [Eubacteriales bacterium]|nr:two-component system response regulator [Eubacteriales bacterium]